jgi:hypothetical protein
MQTIFETLSKKNLNSVAYKVLIGKDKQDLKS